MADNKRNREKSNKYVRTREWARMKAEYCTSECTLADIAKKYKLPYSTLNSRATREKWGEIRKYNIDKIKKAVDDSVLEKATSSEIDKRIKANELHNELFDKGLKVINLILDGYLDDLQSGVKRTPANAKNMEYLLQAIATAQKGQRVTLNITAEQSGIVEPQITYIEGVSLEDI